MLPRLHVTLSDVKIHSAETSYRPMLDPSAITELAVNVVRSVKSAYTIHGHIFSIVLVLLLHFSSHRDEIDRALSLYMCVYTCVYSEHVTIVRPTTRLTSLVAKYCNIRVSSGPNLIALLYLFPEIRPVLPKHTFIFLF